MESSSLGLFLRAVPQGLETSQVQLVMLSMLQVLLAVQQGLKICLGSSTKMATFTFLICKLRHLRFGFRIQGSLQICNLPHTTTCHHKRLTAVICRPTPVTLPSMQQLLQQLNLLTCSSQEVHITLLLSRRQWLILITIWDPQREGMLEW